MATTLWSEFYNDVLPHAPGCTPELAAHEIRNAAIQFCEDTKAWIYEYPDVPFAADYAVYALPPPAETKIHEVVRVWGSQFGREIYPRNHDRLSRLYQDWRTQTSAYPLYYTNLDLEAGTIQFVPKPAAGTLGSARVILCLKPTRTASGIDTKLYEEYLETICLGAKYRLMSSPGKRYTNIELAGAFERMFRSKCNEIYNRVRSALGKDTSIRFTLERFRA